MQEMSEEPDGQGIEREFRKDVIKLLGVLFMSVLAIFILCLIIQQRQDYMIKIIEDDFKSKLLDAHGSA